MFSYKIYFPRKSTQGKEKKCISVKTSFTSPDIYFVIGALSINWILEYDLYIYIYFFFLKFSCTPQPHCNGVFWFPLEFWGTQILKDKDHTNCTGCVVKSSSLWLHLFCVISRSSERRFSEKALNVLQYQIHGCFSMVASTTGAP